MLPDIFFEIHQNLPREGAGRDIYTKKAYDIIPRIKNPKILDIGCGPGLQTIYLAKISKGTIIGLDNHQPFLDELNRKIKEENLEAKVKAINQSMFEMDFPEESFDIIWAEGSIFIIGFEKGLIKWKKFIKKNGFIAVHEMTWLKKNPPKEIFDFWQEVYPAITTIEKNLEIIKKCGYKILDYFALPEDAWWEFYYNPLEQRLRYLRKKYRVDKNKLRTLDEEQKEIDLYRKFKEWYGSVFYIIQKV